jgi:Fic family protein
VGGWGDDDPDEAEIREAEGGLLQLRVVRQWVQQSLRSRAYQTLTPRMILRLHQVAMQNIIPSAGQWRTRDVEIFGSRHAPLPHEDVERLVRDACTFVNECETEDEDDALFLAAFVMWKIAWIHPFDDGNGRTARAASYLIMCQRLGKELDGERPVPQRIKYAPIAYVRALEAADHAWTSGIVDVSQLQHLIEFCLTAQLRNDPPTLPDF